MLATLKVDFFRAKNNGDGLFFNFADYHEVSYLLF